MITPEEITKVAKLSRLKLEKEELETASQTVSGIFDHFSTIQNVDTTNAPVTDAASGLKNIAREDVAETETLAAHDRLLELAPHTTGRHIKVSAVFED